MNWDQYGAHAFGAEDWGRISRAWYRQTITELDAAFAAKDPQPSCVHDWGQQPAADGRIYMVCRLCGLSLGPA